jgi:hypothetical protein
VPEGALRRLDGLVDLIGGSGRQCRDLAIIVGIGHDNWRIAPPAGEIAADIEIG